MTQAQFSRANPVTPEKFHDQLSRHRLQVCRGAFGTQSDVQCLGYDRLCALAIVLYDSEQRHPSERAVSTAILETYLSPYSLGFQHGWDGRHPIENGEEYQAGYATGKALAGQFRWVQNRPSDGYYR